MTRSFARSFPFELSPLHFGLSGRRAAACLLIAAALAALGVGGHVMAEPPRFCNSGATAILIDQSDPLQSSRVQQHLQLLLAGGCVGWHSIVATLAADASQPLNVMTEVTDPGSTEDYSLFSRLLNPARRIAERRTTLFTDPLGAAVDDALTHDHSLDRSPILEAIASLSNMTSFSGSERRLVIVSDMLQHTGGRSQCTFLKKKKSPLDKLCAETIATRPASLPGVHVEILLVRRSGPFATLQNQALKSFWDRQLSLWGSTLVTWREIS